MKETFKRYGIAFIILFIVIAMMLAGTLGVKKFEDSMFEKVNIKITPQTPKK